MRSQWFALACFLGTGLLVICAPVLAAPDAASLYTQYCSVCHGDRGDGNTHVRQGLVPPPRDFTTRQAATLLTRAGMIAAVRDGRPGTAMVGWKRELNESEIAALVDYIRQRFMPVESQAGQRSGREIYGSTCSVCHGEYGTGAVWGRASMNPAPVDFTNPEVQRVLTRDRMILSVLDGVPETAMQSFSSQLSQQEIETVVDFIRTHFMEFASSPAANSTINTRSQQPSQGSGHLASTPPPPGDMAQGRELYLGNCTACHGQKGDGKGPRAYFIYPRPRNFIAPANRAKFTRARLFTAVKHGVRGREMPAWGKVLDDQQIADVSEYVYRTFIRPQQEANITP